MDTVHVDPEKGELPDLTGIIKAGELEELTERIFGDPVGYQQLMATAEALRYTNMHLVLERALARAVAEWYKRNPSIAERSWDSVYGIMVDVCGYVVEKLQDVDTCVRWLHERHPWESDGHDESEYAQPVTERFKHLASKTKTAEPAAAVEMLQIE